MNHSHAGKFGERATTPAPDDALVYVVDDDEDVRQAVALLMRSVGLRTVAYADPHGFLHAFRAPPAAACLLLDLRLPGMCGLELYQTLTARGPSPPVVMMTGHGEVAVAVRAMKAGVFDFIEKPFRGQDLIEAVQQALRQGSRATGAGAFRREVERRAAGLTPREREIMALVVDGERNKAIARTLGLSVRTVEMHRARIMEKMSAGTLSDLVRMGMVLRDPSAFR